MSEVREMKAADVACAFGNFLHALESFRMSNGLSRPVGNVHEVCNAMSDKHGRVCRHVKHVERDDPKDGWQEDMATAMTGYVVYMAMLAKHYRLDAIDGMLVELKKAVKQHGKQEKRNGKE